MGSTSTTASKERPILFSAPMVRAILDGRKTQTRRICKPQPVGTNSRHSFVFADGHVIAPELWRCPYGRVWERLWVREAHYIGGGKRVRYAASPEVIKTEDGIEDAISFPPKKWRPSIHMPRWASRITLEITGVGVERLNTISEEDAIAEGCPGGSENGYFCPVAPYSKPSHWYADLWDKINGKGSWAANPWVWVIEFRRVDANAEGS